MKELNESDLKDVVGGGAGWYWIGKICGFLANVDWDYINTPQGQAVQQALQDCH